MLKKLYQSCLQQIAFVERDLFRASRSAGAARVFAYLTAGVKFIFFQLFLVFIELAVLVALPPKDGYELLISSRHPEEASDEGSRRFFVRRLSQNDKIHNYESYEKRHKKARWVSLASFSAAVAAVVAVSLVVNLILPLAPSVLGATYTWNQTNWGGGATANNAIHPTNQSAWSQYSSASSEITAVNGGEDLELVPHNASTTQTTDAQFNAGTKGQNISISGSGNSASVVLSTATTSTSNTDFSGGTLATTTISGTGTSASVKLTKALHINEYTIGSANGSTAYSVSVTASSVTANSNGTWTIAFSGTPNLSRIFKNDKFTGAGSIPWKVLSVAPDVYKIIVVDSEGVTPVESAPRTGAGTVGRWYTNISAWEAAREGDLVNTRNAIERGLPYYDGAADTVAVTIGGWTTDATHYIEIYVPLSERHRGKWDNNKYRIEKANSAAFEIQEEYVRIDGLQMKFTSTGTPAGSTLMRSTVNNSNSDVRISNNIFQADFTGITSGYSHGITQSFNVITNWKIWNNVFYNFSGGGSGGNTGAIYINDGGNAYIYNNTIVNSRNGITKTSGATIIAKNNITQGSVDGFVNVGGASDYNISDLAGDAPGANSKNSTIVPFVDPSSGDFHLDFRDGTGNPAMNAGADLSADANFPFNTDIDGDTRTGTWDIGADDVGATLVMPHSIGTASRDFSTLQAWEDARDGTTTTRQVFRATQQAAFTEGETVTGQTSGATGVYIKEETTPKSSLKGNYSNGNQLRNVAVSGNYAYVADFAGSLRVIDISNPASPTLAALLYLGGNPYGVFISGNYAYVADGSSGLKIVNIANPLSPTLSGTYGTPVTATGVYVSGNYAYIADYGSATSSSLQIINISNPASPTFAGSYPLAGPWDVFVSGSYAYMADGAGGLKIINISSSTNPTFAGSYASTDAEGVYVSGNYAYVADGNSGLRVVNVSSSTAPTLSGTYNTSGYAGKTFVSGNYAYVADGVSGLQVINVSSSTNPTFAGAYDTPGTAYGVFLSGGYAYVADATPGLQVIKPLEYFTLDSVSGTFQTGETLVGSTSGASSTIGAILTTQGVIEKGEAYNDSTFTAGVSIDGSTTDANHYMWLTAEPGSRHRGVAGTGVKVQENAGADGTGAIIINQNAYSIIEWLDIYQQYAGIGNYYSVDNYWPATDWVVRNNIIHGRDGFDSIGIRKNGTAINTVYNNIIYDFYTGISADNGTYYYNNVIFSNTRGFNRFAGSSLLKNNISVGNSIEDVSNNGGTWNASSSNNISSDATAPGSNSQTSVATSSVWFVSTASDFVDLHIMDGSAAKDAGADLSATFKSDIDGAQDRSGLWDAGADEWFSSSPVYNTAGTFTSGTIDFGTAVNFTTANFTRTMAGGATGKVWGSNNFGQFGNGATSSSNTISTSFYPGLNNIVAVSEGRTGFAYYSLALLSDGTIRSSGSNNYGQLGNGTTTQSLTPVSVSGITNAVAIVAGDSANSYAVLSDGTIKAWGYGGYGQLGDGTAVQRTTPVSVSGITNAVAIAGGRFHALALLSDGTIKAWGLNDHGQLGNGSTTNALTPVTVSGITNAVAIAAGGYSSLAVLADGTIKAWGDNGQGQLGNGTTTQSLTPVSVSGITNAVAIAAKGYVSGDSYSLALLANGTMKAWGTNGYRELGDGTATQRYTPVTVCNTGAAAGTCDANPLTNVVAIAAGGNDYSAQSLALLSDGTIKAWGLNDLGQLGDGTSITRSTPVSVSGITNAVAIAAGALTSLAITGGMRSMVAANNDNATWTYQPLASTVGASIVKAVFPPGFSGNRYLRYKAYLSTADSAFSPQLDDATVNYTGQDVFESATIDFGGPVNFDSLLWNPTSTQPAGAGVQFAVAAKNSDSGWTDSDFVDLNQEAYPSGVTVHTSYVRPSGQCTGYSPCYNSLSAWQAAQNRNIVASNEVEVAQIGGNWTSPDTTAVTIDGWTTDATHYIRIYTAPEARHNGRWNDSKYRLISNTSQVLMLADLVVHHIKIDGLQMQHIITNSGWDAAVQLQGGDGSDVSISNNIIRGAISSSPPNPVMGIWLYWYASGTRTAKIWNNIIYNYTSGTGSGTAIYDSGGWISEYFYNNTICNSDVGIHLSGGIMKNNIAYNNADNYYSSSYGVSSSNNLSGPGSDANIPSNGARNGVTVTFVDAASGDFRLASSDTAAKNYGTSSVSEIGFATDIEGHLRSTGGASWDIGASEYGATGGNVASSLDGNRYLRYKAYLSTADSAFSPQLDDATVNYYYYASSSPSLISSPYNSNDGTNILGKIAWTATTTASAEARVQVRSAPNNGGVPGTWSQWCGYSVCNDTDYFATSTNNVDLTSNHPLKNGNNDQWLQYKINFVSDGSATPTFGGITLTYVVNAPPELQNVAASQQTSDGKVAISYEVKDPDTATGTVTPGYVTPSFSYSTDGGQNWTSITSSYLTAGTLTNKAVNGSTFTQYATVWDAKSQINGTYATNTKIMVSATDNEGANNTASLASSVFTLDVKNPVATVVVDGTKDGQAGAIATNITDNSSAQMMLSNRSDYAADGQNGSSGTWIATSTSLTWSFASGDPVRVYAKVKDAYQNEVTVVPDAPNTPSNATIQDTSNLNLSEFREFISWNVSTSSDFASYKIYRSTNGSSYSLLSTITNSAINYLEDGSSGAWLSNGTTYYYKITVQDSSGNISRYSSVVSDIPDGQGGTDVTPPTITGVTVSNILPTQATVTWTTDELSNSAVYYSTDSSYSSSKVVVSMVTAHSVTLTGLTPGTTYNLRARSTDPLSNVSSYATGTPFATAQGPIISGVAVVSASGNSAEIVWNTNANSDSWVIYSLNSDLSGSQTVGTSTLVGGSGPNYEHRVVLSSLNTNAKYYFKVRSVDGSSNAAEDNNSGAYYTFSTAQDVSPPIISNVTAALASQTSAAISWTTNELSDSQVIYGLDPSSLTSQTAVNSTMTINHSMILNNLTAGAKYYYKVVSADSSANSTQSSVYDFITTAQELIKVTQFIESQPADKTPPLVSDVSFSDIGETVAAISWGTDENSGSFVEFGTTEQLGTTVGQFESTKIHRVDLKWLSPNTLYYLRAKSPDESGNLGTSKVVSFKTLPAKTPEDQAKELAQSIAKNGNTQKSIEELTKEVEQMLADLATKVAPPKITGAEPQVEVNSSFATITWATDRPANSMIAFAGEKDYLPNSDDPYQISVGNAEEQVTEHRVILSDLTPGTTYHFQVRSKGVVGGVGASKDFTFQTGEEASISGVEIKDVKKDSATILWRTNIPASSLLEYGLSAAYGSKQSDDAFNVSHIAILRDLNPGTFYHFKIGGTDKNGNIVASPDLTFTTESLPSLLNVKIDAVKEKEIKISWYTDVPADSTAEYTNLKTNRTESFGDKQLVRNHSLAVTGLDEDAPYKLNVVSKDDKGNEVKSSTYNFQTTRDREAPQITNIQTQSAVSGKDRVQTIVSWKTSEPASSRVIYQEGVTKKPELEKSSAFDNDLKVSHIVVFTDFKPGAVYRIKIESIDGSNNLSESRDLTILTPQRKETVIDLIIKNFQDVFRWTEKMR